MTGLGRIKEIWGNLQDEGGEERQGMRHAMAV